MFGLGKSKIYLYQCKDFILDRFKNSGIQVEYDENKTFVAKLPIDKRDIEIKLYQQTGSVILSITDQFGLIRIPTEKFKDFDKFQLFVMTKLSF